MIVLNNKTLKYTKKVNNSGRIRQCRTTSGQKHKRMKRRSLLKTILFMDFLAIISKTIVTKC